MAKKKNKNKKNKKKKSSTSTNALTIDDLDEQDEREQQQKTKTTTTTKIDPLLWPRRRREDVERCQEIAGTWLEFSLAKANWIQLASNKALHTAFSANRGSTLESVRLWMQHAEQTLCKFIVLDLIMKDQRVQQFHALGRGWVFVLLQRASSGDRPFTKLKIWFESSTRVETDHEMDMKAASLDGPSRKQYVWGYNPQSEIVFFIKGLAPASRSLVCIQKMRPDYLGLDKWATSKSALEECKKAELMTVKERLVVAGKASKKSSKKQMQRDIKEKNLDLKLKLWMDIVERIHAKRKENKKEKKRLKKKQQRYNDMKKIKESDATEITTKEKETKEEVVNEVEREDDVLSDLQERTGVVVHTTMGMHVVMDVRIEDNVLVLSTLDNTATTMYIPSPYLQVIRIMTSKRYVIEAEEKDKRRQRLLNTNKSNNRSSGIGSGGIGSGGIGIDGVSEEEFMLLGGSEDGSDGSDVDIFAQMLAQAKDDGVQELLDDMREKERR